MLQFNRCPLWCGALILTLVALQFSTPSARAQTSATPNSASAGQGAADGQTGSLHVIRYYCTGNEEEDLTQMVVFKPGENVSSDAFDGFECELASGDFVLVSDFGQTIQRFQVPAEGATTVDGLAVSEGPDDAYRLKDSASSANDYIQIEPGQTTTVISYEYEYVFVMPTTPTIPEIDLDDNPPPEPSDFEAGAGAGAGSTHGGAEPAPEFKLDPDFYDPDSYASDEIPMDETDAETVGGQQQAETMVHRDDRKVWQIAVLGAIIAGAVGLFFLNKFRGRLPPPV